MAPAGVGFGSGAVGTVAIDANGNLYATCSILLPGPVFSTALIKLDRTNGSVLRSAIYQRGAQEPIVDGNGLIRVGFQAFDGATFVGGYDRFDGNLSMLGNGLPPFYTWNYTSSRAALLPDTSSSVRLGYSFTPANNLSARGAHLWDVFLPESQTKSTVPSVDREGIVFIGNGSSLLSVNPTDGTLRWSVDVGAQITTQPVIAAAGALYVGTLAGTVHKFHVP